MGALLVKSDQAETLVSTLKSCSKLCRFSNSPRGEGFTAIPCSRGVGRSLKEGTWACEPLQSLISQPPVNSASGGQLFSQPIPQSNCTFEERWRRVLYGKLSALGCFSKPQTLTPFLKAIHLTWAISPAFFPWSCVLPWNLHQIPKVALRN